MTELSINNLNKCYGKKHIINDWSANFNSGYYALIGPNGSGKSTLLSLLGGIVPPDSGEILLSNISLQNQPYNYKKLITYVPDKALFYLDTKAYEFLNYVISIKKIPTNQLNALKRMLKRFDLLPYLGEPIKDLSLGMQKKLFLSTMHIGDPELFLFDEPVNGLDKNATEVFINELKSMLNKIVIFSTHNDALRNALSAQTVNFMKDAKMASIV